MGAIDRETWARIYPWLEKAQDVAAADLPAWIAQIAAERPDIGTPLREVLNYIEALDDDSFLQGPLCVAAERRSRIGQQVGAYTIDALLAEGGMGEVWLAHRSDGHFEGRYAVKLLHLATPGAKALDRFKREGRVLARLTHPNIAHLMDAGALPDGQPFLVLEYIDGAHIDAYCEAHSLSTRSRVVLFLDVLAAVAHAHTSLIIHRDIKPSNVLVTADGSVKLLDFGIAKLVGPDSTSAERGQLTRIDEVALTPSYAAPEQLLGEPLSTATDVFQLGVLLHFLLVGRLPLRKAEGTRSERVMAALGDSPGRMSDAAAGNLRKELRGDLDAIVEKSLRTRPSERYPAATALSADLQRHLDHEPVSARAGIFAYRARKFVRRYRGAVLGTAAALVSLMIATAFSLTQMQKARLQRDQSEKLQKSAQAENKFLMQVMSTVTAHGEPVTPAQILEKGMKLLDRQYLDDPDFRAAMFVRMASRFFDMDEQQRAYDALLKAEGIAQQRGDGAQLAEIECDAVRPLVDLENSAEAARRLELGREALAKLRTQDAILQARCLDAQAAIAGTRSDFPVAIKTEQQAIALLESAGDTRELLYVDLLSYLDYFYNEIGDAKKSFEMTEREVAALERDGLGESMDALSAQNNVASSLMFFGEVKSALAAGEIALTRARAVDSVSPKLFLSYSAALLRLNQPQAALKAADEGLEAAQRGDAVVEFLMRVVRVDVLIALGRLDEAQAALADLERRAKGHEEENHRALIRAQTASASLAMARGKLDDARRTIDNLLGPLRMETKGGRSALGYAALAASRIALAQGRFEDAKELATESLTIYSARARDPAMSADVGDSLLQLAKAQRGLHESIKAADAARSAFGALSAGLGAEHPLALEAKALMTTKI